MCDKTTDNYVKNWCFTWNSEYGGMVVEGWLKKEAAYYVFQEERGEETQRKHFQGYVQFRNKKRLTGVRKVIPGAHWEPARGSPDQNRKYCTKIETRCGGPWEYGEISFSGKRNDIHGAMRTLETDGVRGVLEQYPEIYLKYPKALNSAKLLQKTPKGPKHYVPKTVVLCIGETGTGKSKWAREQIGEDEYYYLHSNTKWFDGYSDQDIAIFDDYCGALDIEKLLNITDNYDDIVVEAKGLVIPFYPTRIIFTTNIHPKDWYTYKPRQIEALARRFKEVRLFSASDIKIIDDPYSINLFFTERIIE